jgi:hypothetical protein
MGLRSFEYLFVNSVLVSYTAERTMATELNVLWAKISMSILDIIIIILVLLAYASRSRRILFALFIFASYKKNGFYSLKKIHST